MTVGWDGSGHVEAFLCEKYDDDRGAIRQIDIRIPPFVATLAAVCAHAVLPGRGRPLVDAKTLVVGGSLGQESGAREGTSHAAARGRARPKDNENAEENYRALHTNNGMLSGFSGQRAGSPPDLTFRA